MIVVGSRADSSGIVRSGRSDWDFICTAEEHAQVVSYLSPLILAKEEIYPDRVFRYMVKDQTGNQIFEIEVAPLGSTAFELLFLAEAWPLQQQLPSCLTDCGIRCPPRQVLAQIKRAHVYQEYGFNKNIRDYHQLRDPDQPWDSHWVADRTAEQNAIHEQLKKISLKKNANQFFGQSAHAIKPLFVHDEVHKVLALPDVPAYTRFQREQVYCDRAMFEALPLEERVRAVVEESQTLAVERILAPYYLQGNWIGLQPEQVSAQKAFEYGLMRVCTTITSGWFREFAIEHWPQAMATCSPTYWSDLQAVATDIPLYEGGIYAAPERWQRTH